MKFIKLFIYSLLFVSATGVAGVELCKPLNTNLKNMDELGGLRSEGLSAVVSRLSEVLPQEGWSLFQETEEENAKVCSKIVIVPKSTVFGRNRFGHRMQKFLRALEREKPKIIEFYENFENREKRISITDYEYNKIAHLAVGILGAESSVGRSHYYSFEHVLSQSQFFENMAVCLKDRTWKSCTEHARTSRGPTQIREVPLISSVYGINRDNLSNPYFAGVATMGFLIETYREYKQKLSNQDYFYVALDASGEEYDKKIEVEEFHIFLTYLYRGDRKELEAGTAKPHESCYYKRVQKFQEYVDMYVHQDKDCSEAGESILGESNK